MEKQINEAEVVKETNENDSSKDTVYPPLTLREGVLNVLKGTAVGIADAIPGVSGGTLAVILKIYDRLLSAITLNIKKLLKNFGFLATVGIGILIGIVIASKLLSYLFEAHNVPTQLFFMGVIIGSIPGIYKECTKERKLKPADSIPFLIAAAAMAVFTFFSSDSAGAETIHPVLIILMTAAAAAAMIMPGISGALVLKTLGGYDLAIKSVNALDLGVLIFYIIGAVIGLLGAAKIISLLIEKHRCAAYCAILGMITASVFAIFPHEFSFDAEGIAGIVMLAVGIALPLLSDRISVSGSADSME